MIKKVIPVATAMLFAVPAVYLAAAPESGFAMTTDERAALYKQAVNVVERGSLIDASTYPELGKIKLLIGLGRLINFQEAENDRVNLVMILSSKLSAEEVEKMKGLGEAVRSVEDDAVAQKKGELELYNFLLEREKNANRYGNLRRYRDYMAIFVNIDWEGLQSELAEHF